MRKIKLLIAPNSFKECADAVDIASNITEYFTDDEFRVTSIPISDGGDGFLKICVDSFKLEIVTKETSSFYDESQMLIPVGISRDRTQIFIESAEVIGMKRTPPWKRNPSILNSNNFGSLLLKLEKEYPNATKILVGLGGTATNDLGLGLCVPFGLKLFNKEGNELPVEPNQFVDVNSITLPGKRFSIPIEVVTDVKVPLYGSGGTSKTFAKQKGATAKEIEILEQGVINLISVLKNEHGIDLSQKLFGAGGGLLLGLSLVANQNVCFAEKYLLDSLHLEREVSENDFIITGEGSFDEQSLMNKGTGILIGLAQRHQKKLFLICGNLNPADYFQNSSEIKAYPIQKYFITKQNSIDNYKAGIKKACMEIKSYILSH
ncbi:MAG: glycerate kinase [Ignavibacteriaceae bacterium]|jgi:glycerate kinase